MSVCDLDPGVVDGLALVAFKDLSLESSLQELLHVEPEDVIELGLGGLQEAVGVHSPHEGLTLENSPGVGGLEEEEFSGGLSEPGERELESPDLLFSLKPVFADELHPA